MCVWPVLLFSGLYPPKVGRLWVDSSTLPHSYILADTDMYECGCAWFD